MNSEYILWGIPAYIAFLIFQLARPVRNRSGWDFVASVSIFALTIYVATSLVFLGLKNVVSVELWNTISSFWKANFPSQGSVRLFTGFLLSIPVGLIIGTVWSRYNWILTEVGYWWTGKKKSYQFSDVFFATCHDLLGKPVLLTLNNSKVYVGVLLQATDDPNESARYIKMLPVMSGYRIKDSGQVIFDTDYVGKTQDSNDLPNRDLLVSMSAVVTLARFDKQLHDWFVDTGRTVIKSSEEKLSVQKTEEKAESISST